MEIGKVRKLLALLFALLAILFFCLYKKEKDAVSVLSAEFVNGAVDNLNSRGIKIDSKTVEKLIPDKDIYILDNEESDEDVSLLADKVRVFVFGSASRSVRFETPEGVSYGIFDASSDNSEIGRISIQNDEGSFSFTKNGYFGYSEIKTLFNSNVGVDKDVAQNMSDFYAMLCNSDEFSWKISGSQSKNGILVVSLVQTIEDYDITDYGLNFAYKDKELIAVSGKVLSGKPEAKYHNTLLDGINALYELDIENISEIKSEELVYLMRKTADNKFYLIPGWKIISVDKQGVEVVNYIDAL